MSYSKILRKQKIMKTTNTNTTYGARRYNIKYSYYIYKEIMANELRISECNANSFHQNEVLL